MEFSLHISDGDAAGSALTDRPAVGAELGRKTWRETRKELRELTQRLRGEKREVSDPRKPVQMTFLLKPATNGIFRSFPHKSSHHFCHFSSASASSAVRGHSSLAIVLNG